MANYCR